LFEWRNYWFGLDYGCGTACAYAIGTESPAWFAVRCTDGPLSNTWLISATTDATTPVSVTADTICTVQQVVEFEDPVLAVGTVLEQQDYRPYGLFPFINGSYVSALPIVSTTLVYEFAPWVEGESPMWSKGIPYEYHAVGWFGLDLASPFDVGECIEPELGTECPEPDFAHWRFGNWIAWLWCNQERYFRYFVSYWAYMICMLYRPFAITGNTLAQQLHNIVLAIELNFNELVAFWHDWFNQLSGFLAWYIPKSSVCYSSIAIWWFRYALETWPGLVDFLAMAITEIVPWLTTLLTWIATDLIAGTVGLILTTITTAINNSADFMQFIVEQFNTSFLEAVAILGVVVQMVNFLITLAAGMITGLMEALSSDTEAELFAEATYFWRGIDLFDEITSETPYVILNTVAIGIIGVNLALWTIAQIAELFDDLMQI